MVYSSNILIVNLYYIFHILKQRLHIFFYQRLFLFCSSLWTLFIIFTFCLLNSCRYFILFFFLCWSFLIYIKYNSLNLFLIRLFLCILLTVFSITLRLFLFRLLLLFLLLGILRLLFFLLLGILFFCHFI